jgi:2-polyprenyl-6-hydroxyphenyl methylase/3-demethylubiquinone-9 3-methyltransferase
MSTTINPDEVAKFSAMAEDWWNPAGSLKPLHKLNPARLAYIRRALLRHFGRDDTARTPFTGLRVLDIGCGGGLLSEPLTRLGASVTGIDAADQNIAVAALHARAQGLEINYRATTAETVAASGARYDLVLNMEVVEHVDNVPLYMKSCAELVAPGGLLLTATLNRTPRAALLAVFAAESILRWLPRGTHNPRKFLTPDEISTLNQRHGLSEIERIGLVFHPIADEWRESRDLGINYMVLAAKPAL